MNNFKNIVLLGKSGMLAQAIRRVAQNESIEILVLSRSDGVDLTKIKSHKELEAMFDNFNPDLVFNATGITNLNLCEQFPEQAWMLHARLPALLAAWSNEYNKPWVHVSTDHYYSGTENIYHAETDPEYPLNEYAASKLAGEYLALTSKRALVLRTNIIGKRGWDNQPNFAEWTLDCLEKQTHFEAYTDTWTSSIEVNQFAKLALKMAASGANGLMNLACSESLSKAEWIEKIARYAGLGINHMTKVPSFSVDKSMLKKANTMGLDCSQSKAYLNSLGLSLPNSDEVVEDLLKSFGGTVYE